MNEFYYTVQLECDGQLFIKETLEEVFALLKREELVSIFRYNDKDTGSAFAKVAAERQMSKDEQAALPVFIITTLSDEGTFVESEAFWIANYMLDEFYNPERMPHVEKFVGSSSMR